MPMARVASLSSLSLLIVCAALEDGAKPAGLGGLNIIIDTAAAGGYRAVQSAELPDLPGDARGHKLTRPRFERGLPLPRSGVLTLDYRVVQRNCLR